MNSTALSKIASIRTGYTLRDKIDLGNTGDVAVIQPKDIINGSLQNPAFLSSKEFPNLQNHFLNEGDILVSNKGVRFVIYRHRKHETPHIATSAFFVVAPTSNVVPLFLEWYLTLPETIKALESILTHSTIPTLTKKDLERVEVVVPTLEIQKKIETIIKVASDEIMLLNDLIARKHEHRDSYCNELINKA
jgi:restriction endonuclease S subunit